MRKHKVLHFYFQLSCLGLIGLLASSVSASAEDSIKLVQTWGKVAINRPVALVVPPDGSGRHFLVQQRGKIILLPQDETAGDAKIFLDLSDRHLEESKETEFEEGLLGLAFHPDFASNGRFYLYYTQQAPKRSVLSELQVSAADPQVADMSTERILLEVPLPFANHHSGNLLFGPDGFLYISIGDGGGKVGGDPLRTAQNLSLLTGKILRLDVTAKTPESKAAYSIPKDNPFIKKKAARPEIYAFGLRNPWGLHFDDEGTFWCADVGQDLWEEINHIVKGGNYGWSHRDGARPFAQRADAPPARAEFIDPVFEYSHAEGLSITGGLVYRGQKMPALRGAYLYGDWAKGLIWALRYDKAGQKVLSKELLCTGKQGVVGKGLLHPTAFCEDKDREVLMLDWLGPIYRITQP